MEAIVAVFSDWGIGDSGTQPVVLHADRVHFQNMTQNTTVIAGRKTLEDFPGGKPLKGRNNIIISRQDMEIENAVVAHSYEEAVSLAGNDPCFVIGGASVYMQLFNYLERIYVTKIELEPACDSYFPNLDRNPDWICTRQEPWEEENGVKYCFCTYERKH